MHLRSSTSNKRYLILGISGPASLATASAAAEVERGEDMSKKPHGLSEHK